jgi:hypothetical protein
MKVNKATIYNKNSMSIAVSVLHERRFPHQHMWYADGTGTYNSETAYSFSRQTV